MARKQQGSKWIRPTKRLAIYLRDGMACAYCGSAQEDGAALSLDHIVAVELGGSNEAENLVTCCIPCNSSKQDLSTRSWFAVLRDRGVDTDSVGPRVRRLVAKNLDIGAAKAIIERR